MARRDYGDNRRATFSDASRPVIADQNALDFRSALATSRQCDIARKSPDEQA
jgi:hypothetical protein